MSKRVGLVGCGQWGQFILRDLKALGCCVSVVARSPESRARAVQHGANALHDSIEEVDDQDCYVVATPTLSHAAAIRTLLARRRPIFCEKPLTTSVAQLDALGDDAAELVFCMDKWRYHAGVRWLASCAREGRLGSVQGIQLIRVGGRSKSNPLSAVWHLMPHDLSIALELLGTLPPVRASSASTLGQWAYGCHVMMGERPWVSIEVSERRQKHHREIRLVCSNGEAIVDGGYADHVTVRRHERLAASTEERITIDGQLPLYAELEAFIHFVDGRGPAPKSSLADARLIVRHLEEIHRVASLPLDATTGGR